MPRLEESAINSFSFLHFGLDISLVVEGMGKDGVLHVGIRPLGGQLAEIVGVNKLRLVVAIEGAAFAMVLNKVGERILRLRERNVLSEHAIFVTAIQEAIQEHVVEAVPSLVLVGPDSDNILSLVELDTALLNCAEVVERVEQKLDVKFFSTQHKQPASAIVLIGQVSGDVRIQFHSAEEST